MTTVSAEQKREIDDVWGRPQVCVRLSESFNDVVRLNPLLRIEQNASGEVVLMSPTGAEGSYRNSEIGIQLGIWAKSYGGRTFDSNVLFCLANGAKKSPDASWIAIERWNVLTSEERKGYAPICPDFVVELRSESDRLIELQEKMDEYVENGVRLGWLIDPLLKQVHIYRPGQPNELLQQPDSVSGENVLPGFVLELSTIWMDS